MRIIFLYKQRQYLQDITSNICGDYCDPKIIHTLRAMSDVGLNNHPPGQPLIILSGGECQWIKLASELHKEGSIYEMDEQKTSRYYQKCRLDH